MSPLHLPEYTDLAHHSQSFCIGLKTILDAFEERGLSSDVALGYLQEDPRIPSFMLCPDVLNGILTSFHPYSGARDFAEHLSKAVSEHHFPDTQIAINTALSNYEPLSEVSPCEDVETGLAEVSSEDSEGEFLSHAEIVAEIIETLRLHPDWLLTVQDFYDRMVAAKQVKEGKASLRLIGDKLRRLRYFYAVEEGSRWRYAKVGEVITLVHIIFAAPAMPFTLDELRTSLGAVLQLTPDRTKQIALNTLETLLSVLVRDKALGEVNHKYTKKERWTILEDATKYYLSNFGSAVAAKKCLKDLCSETRFASIKYWERICFVYGPEIC